MPFTALTAKTNGSTSLSRAEVQDLFDNIAWLRTPPAYRLRAGAGNTATAGTTVGVLDYANGAEPVFEYTERGGGEQPDATYHADTGGLWVNVGDVEPGVWINGAMVGMEADPGGLAAITTFWRRTQLRRGTGSVWTELADVTVSAATTGARTRRVSSHICGAGTFTSSTDRVEVRVQAGATVDVLSNVQPDRRWGLWVGENLIHNQNFAAARPTTSGASGTQVVTWWNQMRLNQIRLQVRPSAQLSKTGMADQAVTANTPTVVTMSTSDWATDTRMTTTAANRLTIQQNCWVLVGAQITARDMRESFGAGSFLTVGVNRNGSSVLTANAAEITATTGSTVAQVYGLIQCNAGDYLELIAQAGENVDIEGSRGTQMWVVVVSSNAGVSSGRQVFDQMPPPAEIPNFANYSGTRLPLGVMKIASDLTDRLWHRPVVRLSMPEPQEIGQGEWVDLDCSDLLSDYTDMVGRGFTPAGNGGFRVPWPGTWLLCGRVAISSKSAEGPNIGDFGNRGMRFKMNNGVAGQVLSAAMKAASHGWTKTICETFVVNRADQVINLQGFASGLDGDDLSAVVTSADIWAVEVGDGTTWYPRGEP